MSILFEPTKIKNVELRNRFVRSATYDACADETGQVTENQLELFQKLAAGGVGLIVTGIACVHPSGQMALYHNSIANDDCIPGFKRLTATVHDRGAKIAVQLFHAGRDAGLLLKEKNEEAMAPSFVPDDPYPSHFSTDKYRAMTEDEIWEIIRAFGDAAGRAKEAGFDAVQIHGAHAYLPMQFLSPFTNRRDDDWGGPLENRLRFHREIYRDISAKVGEDYPVLIKLGVEDGFSGGFELSEGKKAAQYLAQLGYDSLEISQGLRGKFFEETEFRTQITKVDSEAYFRDWCKEIKAQVNVPTMMVGGLRTFELMEEVIQKGEADFVSLCRPLIREPNLINEWKSGNYRKPTCVSCNKCLFGLGEPVLRCRLEEKSE